MSDKYLKYDDIIDALYENEYTTHFPMDEIVSVISNVQSSEKTPKGHWIIIHRPYPNSSKYQCSNCGEKFPQPFKHCPECTSYNGPLFKRSDTE